MDAMLRTCFCFALFFCLAALTAQAQQLPPKDAPPPIERWAAEKILPPKLIQSAHPEYPDEAKVEGIDGICSVSLVIDTEGDPQDTRILHCTDPAFADSSLKAASQYRFEPAMTQAGKPIAVAMPVILGYRGWDGAQAPAMSPMLLFMPLGLLAPVLIMDTQWMMTHYGHGRHMSNTAAHRLIGTAIHPDFVATQAGESEPGADGIYPLTRRATAPRVIRFADEGYGVMAFIHAGSSACVLTITIDKNGHASDPQVLHCERPELEKPAVDSLLNSVYKSGYVQGKQVPIRSMVHLYYGDVQIVAQPTAP